MGIYGESIFTNNIVQEAVMDPMEFMMFCMESIHEVDLMIERVNITSVLEASTAVATVGFDKSESGEKVKKTIIEKAKEIYNKMVTMIKEFVDKAKRKITQFYLNTNVKDMLMSKNKNIVCWENLEKAKENGWFGLEKSVIMIGQMVNIRDSSFFDIDSNLKKYDVTQEDVDKILMSTSLEEAEEKSKEIKKRLRELKKEVLIRDNKIAYFFNNTEKASRYASNPYFAISNIDGKDNKHYYPTRDMFELTCKIALEGQSEIKKMKFENGGYIKSLRKVQTINLKNITETASKEKTDAQKLQMIYYKTVFDHYGTIIFVMNRVISAVIGMFTQQYSVAIKAFSRLAHDIKIMVKPNEMKYAN